MLRSMNKLLATHIAASDGNIGTLFDVYLDDVFWKIRYFVVDTGNWLPGKRVLIAPQSILEMPDNPPKVIPLNLTCQQVEDSPSYNTEKPISRQYEISLHQYYQWSGYWLLGNPYGILTPYHNIPDPEKAAAEELSTAPEHTNEHLRSGVEIMRYYVDASNGNIGHVEDFLIEDEDWRINYLILDTRNWWPGGKKMAIAQHWIENVDWNSSLIKVELSKEVVKNSPEFSYENVNQKEIKV